MSQNGKGSRHRPKTINQETWDKNWDRIFHSEKKSKNVKTKRDKSSDK